MSPEDKSQNRPVDGSPRTVAIYVGSEGLSHMCGRNQASMVSKIVPAALVT